MLPLDGIRVIGLTNTWAGPIAGKMCAEMGAEVIKVEGLQRWDVTRANTYPDNESGEEPWNRGGNFHVFNNGELGITLNLSDDRGKELFKKLVKISDVLIQNFSPRVMGNLGLDYDSLVEIKPDLIMVSMSGFGQTGPWRDRVAYAPVMEVATGLPYFMRNVRGLPHLPLGLGDWSAAVATVGALLIALINRQKTGQGEYIDVAGRESMLCFSGEAVMDYVLNSRVWESDDFYSTAKINGLYRCQGDDEWISISINSDEEWEALCRLMDEPSWAKDDKFSDFLNRWKNRRELDELIEQWTSQFDHFHLMELLQQAGIAAGAVANPQEILFSPHLQQRKFYRLIKHPAVEGERPFPKLMPAISSVAAEDRPVRPAPQLGQDNRYILEEWLGVTREEIAKLEEDGVIGTVPVQFPQTRGYDIATAAKQGKCTVDPDYRERISRFFGSGP